MKREQYARLDRAHLSERPSENNFGIRLQIKIMIGQSGLIPADATLPPLGG